MAAVEAAVATDVPAPEAGWPLAEAPPTQSTPWEKWVGLAVAVAASIFVLAQLHPSLLLADTTPAGGDMGAHVWGPAYLRDHLLPSGRLTGWAPDWYAGFPAYHFYMVVPALAIVVADLALPYGVAFKLVTVLGVVMMPVAAWAMGRLARVPPPGPALLAVATVPFLFDRAFSIYGGNVASTLAGEFSFSISLMLALLYLGVLASGLRTGRHRVVAPVLLALVGLCHLIPALFAVAGTAALLVLHPDRARAGYVAVTGAVAGALGAFWALPFWWRRGFMTDMGWEKLPTSGSDKTIWTYLLRNEASDDFFAGVTTGISFRWVLGLAAVGAVVSVARRRTLGMALAITGLVFAVAFVAMPQGRLWNARLLPFWYLCLYLLAGLAVAEVGRTVGRLIAVTRAGPAWPARVATAAVSLAVVLVIVAMPLGGLPLGHRDDKGVYRWMGLATVDNSYVDDWTRWNYTGYERKDAYPELHGIVSTMARVGEQHGCGRASWEAEQEHNRYGTPMALMLLSFWTDGCIRSMEGLYFESSATTPYHFLSVAELSAGPSNPQRDLPYRSLDMTHGVQHLQLLGVRYYMAISPAAKEAAGIHPELTKLASSGPWEVYRVESSEPVVPLDRLPAVVEEAGDGEPWQDLAVDFYQAEPSEWEVPLAGGGPEAWPRVERGDRPPRLSVRPARVRRVVEGRDRIAFDVDRPGTPVLVKTSYFPNWKAHGARGPWRVTPNFMVVVPTDTHVELRYGFTGIDLAAWGLTLLGLAALVVLAVRGPLRLSERRPAAHVEPQADQPDRAP